MPMVALASAAQTPNTAQASNWDRVKMLAPGTELRIASGASKRIQGALISASDSEILLTQAAGPQSFPRPEISAVSVKTSGHRVRNALIGLSVGTLAGIAIGVAAGRAQTSSCRKSSELLCGLGAIPDEAGGAIGGLLGGALIGAFWPTGRWQQIYAL